MISVKHFMSPRRFCSRMFLSMLLHKLSLPMPPHRVMLTNMLLFQKSCILNDNSIEANSDAFMMRAGEDPSSSCRPSNNNLCTSTGFTCFVGEICSSYNMTLCERPGRNRRAMSHWFRKEMHTIGHCVKLARLDGAIILKPLFMCQNGACEMAGCSSP